ncbi:hypothetical protein [Micromonospora sp. NPDC049679]|uniref:hypothetical protein n=1 Tax=Micromonospora sp. NPDC049679 TaxID=3155920 RepID=UPI003411D15F
MGGRTELRDRLGLHAVAAALTLLVLAPLVRPGYVLRYDMVFVPRQPLRWDLIAPGDALPRAVPQDAVVSLLSQVAPGWLLQRVALGAAIWLAAVGAARLVPAQRRLTRVIAAVGYAWTPYLAERLLLGQWGLLLAYAALPWLVAAAIGVRTGRRGALPRLVVAAAAAAITPTGGVLALLTTVVLVPGRRVPGPRMTLAALGAVAALNAPWLAAAAVTVAGGRSDPLGVAAFAARGENWAGPLGALAGTGGIWNAQTTPASRASLLVPLVTVGLLALAAAGFPVLRRRWPDGVATRLGVLAVGAFVLASAGVLPGVADALRWLVAEVPGAGLLRDGQKLLIPYALCLVLCAALGAERLAARLPRPRDRMVLVGLVLLPVVVLPDLALGAGGRLRPVRYPDDWRTVERLVAADPGPVLSLPLTMYRSYGWNPGTVVIDPLPRYLPAEVITDDTLIVGDLVITGENERVRRIRALPANGASAATSGVRWVVVQHGSRGAPPAGWWTGLQPVHSGPDLTLYRNPAVTPDARPPTRGRWIALLGAVLALVVLGAAIGALLRRPTAW